MIDELIVEFYKVPLRILCLSDIVTPGMCCDIQYDFVLRMHAALVYAEAELSALIEEVAQDLASGMNSVLQSDLLESSSSDWTKRMEKREEN